MLIVSSFVELCVLVSFFLLATSIFCMAYDIGSYIVWARLSSASALVAFLGASLYSALNSLQPQRLTCVVKRALYYALPSLVAATVAFRIGGAWRPVATLLSGLAILIVCVLVPVELWLNKLLCRLDRES